MKSIINVLCLSLLLCATKLPASESTPMTLRLAQTAVLLGSACGMFSLANYFLPMFSLEEKKLDEIDKKIKQYQSTNETLEYIKALAQDATKDITHISAKTINKLKIKQVYKDLLLSSFTEKILPDTTKSNIVSCCKVSIQHVNAKIVKLKELYTFQSRRCIGSGIPISFGLMGGIAFGYAGLLRLGYYEKFII